MIRIIILGVLVLLLGGFIFVPNVPFPPTPSGPVSCNGTIDLSTGCALPMLGGL